LARQSQTYRVGVPHSAGADIGWLYSNAEIIETLEPTEQGSAFVVRIEPRHRAEFVERFNGRFEAVA
jgi:GTP-binding protein HflX